MVYRQVDNQILETKELKVNLSEYSNKEKLNHEFYKFHPN